VRHGAALLLLLLLAGPAAPQAQPADAAIAAGRADFQAGRYEEALTHFAEARAIAPEDWRGHALQSMTLIQQAIEEPDPRRREALLREAEGVAGVMVKLRLVEFHDPLYRFIRGLVISIQGDDAKAYAVLAEALRSPRAKFARYDEIDLRGLVERAYAVAAVRVASRLIRMGKFEPADVELDRAGKYLKEGDPQRYELERLLAVTSEHLGRRDKAIEHIRRCMELRKDDPGTVQEFVGVIALVYLANEDLENGRKILDGEAPADSRNPEIVAARCTLVFREALRDRSRLDQALDYLRREMKAYAPEDVYRLVLLYKDLVLAKVGQREAQTEPGKALLREAIPILEREIGRRPECPPLYYALYRIHKLLGDVENERRYQELHEKKKEEWEHQEKYDARGRPRCGG